jgi:signal transduction histidine kinase
MVGFLGGIIVGSLVTAAGFVASGAIVYRRYALRTRILNERTRRAERLAELGTLTGGLAHEIKNPLSTVLLNLQLLREDISPHNPAYSRLVNRLTTVQKETTRLRETLDEFLRFAGNVQLDRKSVDVGSMLEELIDFIGPQAQLQRVLLRAAPDQPPLVANLDERLIKQALLNLILNALQAMPNGGEVILSGRAENGTVILDVTDTGPGIEAGARERVFDAYYSKRKGGTGLGLAITKRIVEEHGGKISVISEIGKGADFRIELPGAVTREERKSGRAKERRKDAAPFGRHS